MQDEPQSDDLRRSVAVAKFLHVERLGAAAVIGSKLSGDGEPPIDDG